MASPYGTFGSAFGGYAGGYAPANNPFTPQNTPAGGYDRNLFDADQGRPALGFYADAAGQDQPFRNWLQSGGTHQQLWTDYLGKFAARNDPSFAFTNYLAENDPYKTWSQLGYQERGVANPAALSPFVQLLNL